MTTKFKVYDNGVIHIGEVPKDYLEKALERQRELINRTLRYGRRLRNDEHEVEKE